MTYPARIPPRDRLVSSVVRAAIAVARSKYGKSDAGAILRQVWPDDEVADLIVRGPSEPPAEVANTAALARILVPEFVEAMVPYSASAALIQGGLSYTFDGAAYVSVPSFAAMPTAVAYVGEGTPVPVVMANSTAPPALTPKKFASAMNATRPVLTVAS